MFAAANTKLPDQLYEEELVERPVEFAANRLVIAVPADGDKVKSVDDLGAAGVRIAAGSPSVPVGSYTRDVLAKLGSEQAEAIEHNIRSNEPDVSGVVGKVSQGAVDAGLRLHHGRGGLRRAPAGDRAARPAPAGGGLRGRGRKGHLAQQRKRTRSSTGCSTATAQRLQGRVRAAAE